MRAKRPLATVGQIYDFIKANRNRFGVRRTRRWLEIAPRGVGGGAVKQAVRELSLGRLEEPLGRKSFSIGQVTESEVSGGICRKAMRCRRSMKNGRNFQESQKSASFYGRTSSIARVPASPRNRSARTALADVNSDAYLLTRVVLQQRYGEDIERCSIT